MGLERINELRKQNGFTIEELSEKSNVPVSTLKKICAGTTTNPALETVKAIASALNCSLSEFDDTKKAPANRQEPMLSMEFSDGILDGLIRAGLISDGEDLSDDDLAFLVHIAGLLDTWFSRKR